MFGPDALHSLYIEDRQAETKRRMLEAQAKASTMSSAVATPEATRPSTPSIASQMQIGNKPAGVLGNLWQGFFKPANFSPITSATSSAASTPVMEKSELEAHSERMRDVDYCNMRPW